MPVDPHAPSDASLPVRIGGYRVVRRLATGGTSDVLLARAEGPHGFERAVVLKLLLQQYRDDEQFERMFAREAAAYARLSHPAIVKLYDFFSDAGQLVMVLEYVEGLPLHKMRALLRKPRFLDDPAAMFVGARIFGALAAAHAARDPQTGEESPVIHRDVNPSNVLIPWDGHVKIADFGIAKVAGVDNDKTQAGFIKGTYGYMAPEQVRGETVTVRTDVYVASLLLWELLVGRKAVVRGSGSDLEVLRAMAEPAFPSLAALRPDLPRPVLDALARGLEKDPEKRSIGAEEIAAALRGASDLEHGRQRLVDTLGAIRPPSFHDDPSAPVVRAPPLVGAPSPPDSSADATIPNQLAIAATIAVQPPRALHDTISEVQRVPQPPRPVQVRATSTPAPPRPLVSKATLMGISSQLPVPPPPPAAPPPAPPPPPQASPPQAPPQQAPPMQVQQPPPPPAPMQRPQLAPPPPPPVASLAAPPPPPPWMTMPLPAAPAPPYVPPTPAPAPVAWSPGPAPVQPMSIPSEPPPVPRGPGRLLAVVVLIGAVIGVAAVVLLWAHGRVPAAYVPPPRPSTTASTTKASVTSAAPSAPPAQTASESPTVSAAATESAPAPAPAVPAASTAPADTASAPSSPGPVATTGTITVPESRAGHRIYVEKHVIGQSPGTFTVRCGWHAVKVGSQGYEQNVNVPCGGDIEVK